MLLVLEDNVERVEQFTNALRYIDPGLPLMCWRSAHAMVRESPAFLPQATLISLDHDLLADEDEEDLGDGVAVAKFLVSQPFVCPVIIHSSNSERASWMAGEFELAGWPYWRVVPFGEDWVELHWRPTVQLILNRRVKR